MIIVTKYSKDEHLKLLKFLKGRKPVNLKGNTADYIIDSTQDVVKMLRVHKKLFEKKADLDGGSFVIKRRTIKEGKRIIKRFEIYYAYNTLSELMHLISKYEKE